MFGNTYSNIGNTFACRAQTNWKGKNLQLAQYVCLNLNQNPVTRGMKSIFLLRVLFQRSQVMASSFVPFFIVCILPCNSTHFSRSLSHFESQSYEENSPSLKGVNIFRSLWVLFKWLLYSINHIEIDYRRCFSYPKYNACYM